MPSPVDVSSLFPNRNVVSNRLSRPPKPFNCVTWADTVTGDETVNGRKTPPLGGPGGIVSASPPMTNPDALGIWDQPLPGAPSARLKSSEKVEMLWAVPVDPSP